MDNRPLVSILMTAYNREKYIGEAIESVLASTYENWELIIVDDVSIDSTVEIAKKYEGADPRIQVYTNELNLGDYPNRNKAASYAIGKYLKYLDSDDLILPLGLEIFVKLMEENPSAAYGLSLDLNFGIKKAHLMSPSEVFFGHFGGKGVLNCGPSGSIIRKNRFNEVNGFSKQRFISDTDLWLKLAQKYNMLILKPDLIKWREHIDQEFNLGKESSNYIILRYRLNIFYIRDKGSPLKIQQRVRFTINQYRILISNILKLFKVNKQRGYSLLKSVILYKQ